MKKNITISIDIDLLKKFRIRLIELDELNMSIVIEKLIEKYLKEKNGNNN